MGKFILALLISFGLGSSCFAKEEFICVTYKRFMYESDRKPINLDDKCLKPHAEKLVAGILRLSEIETFGGTREEAAAICSFGLKIFAKCEVK